MIPLETLADQLGFKMYRIFEAIESKSLVTAKALCEEIAGTELRTKKLLKILTEVYLYVLKNQATECDKRIAELNQLFKQMKENLNCKNCKEDTQC